MKSNREAKNRLVCCCCCPGGSIDRFVTEGAPSSLSFVVAPTTDRFDWEFLSFECFATGNRAFAKRCLWRGSLYACKQSGIDLSVFFQSAGSLTRHNISFVCVCSWVGAVHPLPAMVRACVGTGCFSFSRGPSRNHPHRLCACAFVMLFLPQNELSNACANP